MDALAGRRHLIAPLAECLGVAHSRVRVITDDVGGAFGIKIPPYPEHVLVAWRRGASGGR